MTKGFSGLNPFLGCWCSNYVKLQLDNVKCSLTFYKTGFCSNRRRICRICEPLSFYAGGWRSRETQPLDASTQDPKESKTRYILLIISAGRLQYRSKFLLEQLDFAVHLP
jgi:hypothetical protein